MSFGKAFLSSCLGALVAMICFAGLAFILFFSAIVGLSSDEEVVVQSNSVLHLKLDAQITELQKENPFAGLVGNEIPNIGLLQLKQAIEHASTDDKIKGIYLEVSMPMAGFA